MNINGSLRASVGQGLPIEQAPLGSANQKPANVDNTADESKVEQQAKRIIDYGLKIFKKAPTLTAFTPGQEQSKKSQNRGKINSGDRIGDYLYKRDKRFGVEPGFEATKAWRETDTEQLNEPTSKFHRQANEFIQDVVFSLESKLQYDSETDYSSDSEDVKKFKGLAKEAAVIIRDQLGTDHPNLNQDDHHLPGIIDQLRNNKDLRPTLEKYLMSKRAGRAEDEARLKEPGHPFNNTFKSYIKEQLGISGSQGNAFIRFKDAILAKHPEIAGDQEAIINEIAEICLNSNQSFVNLTDVIDTVILKEENNNKFQKPHFVKLDYNEPDQAGLVKIPMGRAKGITFIHKMIHRNSTAGTIKEKNLAAVTEALSNDIFQALGVESQKLKIIDAKYTQGEHKLLLDGTYASGPKGESFSTFEGSIRSGKLKGNCVVDPDTEELIPIDEKDLAATKITALFMGDRDKIGSKGANIGYVVKMEDGKKIAKLMNIDPGKSLEIVEDFAPSKENSSTIGYFIKKLLYPLRFYLFGKTDRMKQHNIHNNFSFDQPDATIPDKIMKGYKNFTIFDDTTLAEKMEGVKRIKDNWGQIETIFDNYSTELAKKTAADGKLPNELDFVDEITSMRKLLTDRRKYILDVFADRLVLNNQELTILDHLEKLTSPTKDRFKDKGEVIKLKHLQVDSKQRKEWKMQAIDIKDAQGAIAATTTLTCTVHTEKEAEKIIRQLNKHADRINRSIEPHPTALPPIHLVPQEDGRYQIQIRVDKQNLAPVALYFEDETEIAATKKQKLFTA